MNSTDPIQAQPEPEDWLITYGDYLYRLALSKVRSSTLAEDLVQDTLLSAIKAYEQFEGRSSLKTWLTRILNNKIIDHFRKNRREVLLENDELADDVINRHFNSYGIWNSILDNWARSPEKALQDQQLYAALTKCLSKLPDKNREVLIKKTVEDIDTDFICKQFDISPSNLWVLLHRTRLALRDCLEKNWVLKA